MSIRRLPFVILVVGAVALAVPPLSPPADGAVLHTHPQVEGKPPPLNPPQEGGRLVTLDPLQLANKPAPVDPAQPEGKQGGAGVAAATSRLSPELQISLPTTPENDRHVPAVIYNFRHREYLVLWHNEWSTHRDIYARRVSEDGRLLSWFSVSAGPNDRAQPAVAYNAANDEYLVVWMYNANGDGSTWEIWGRTVAWNGASMGAEFQIITWPNRTFWTPKVAWNGFRNEYLVVWNAFDATTFLPTDVAHALLSANGTNLFGTVISSADQPHDVDLAYNVAKDEYLVVWTRVAAPGNGDVVAARVSGANGVVVNPPGIINVDTAAEDQRKPAVATNQQGRYMVVWEHVFPGPCCDWDIRAQELDANGSPVGGWSFVASTTEDEANPAVAARPGSGREYVATWQQPSPAGVQVLARQWGDVTRGTFEVAVAAFWDNNNPAVAAGNPSFLIAYEGDAAGDPTVYRHIYGRLWWPESVYVPLVVRKYKK
jgi:hypothetical protein